MPELINRILTATGIIRCLESTHVIVLLPSKIIEASLTPLIKSLIWLTPLIVLISSSVVICSTSKTLVLLIIEASVELTTHIIRLVIASSHIRIGLRIVEATLIKSSHIIAHIIVEATVHIIEAAHIWILHCIEIVHATSSHASHTVAASAHVAHVLVGFHLGGEWIWQECGLLLLLIFFILLILLLLLLLLLLLI